MSSRSTDRGLTITFDKDVFSVETVKKAAYKYLDRVSIEFQSDGQLLRCFLSFTPETSTIDMDKTVRDIKSEVLDQDLRERIQTETAPIRNLILAHAFSRTGLIADDQVPGN